MFFQRLAQFSETEQDVQETIEGFLLRHDCAMCLGAVDGTLIRMHSLRMSMLVLQVEVEWDVQQTVYKKASCNSTSSTGNGVREALTQFFTQNSI